MERGGYTRDNGDPTKQRPTLEGQANKWLAPNVPNVGRTAHHAEVTGRTPMHNGKKVQIGLESGGGDLQSQATAWAAPMVADARGSAGVGKAELPNQAQNWPAPATRDHKGSSEGSITRQDGK